jgi:16S rRNA (cytosine967-C5)-methyltransferase
MTNNNKANARALAAQALAKVIQRGVSLTEALATVRSNVKIDTRDQGFIQELCYGVLRWYEPLQCVLSPLLRKKLLPRDQDIQALLLLGLYQLIYLKTADYAALHETVQAAKTLKKNWAVPLVNAVLRSFQRQQASLLKKCAATDEMRYAHPSWIIDRLKRDWPAQWSAILDANNEVPPLSLRVNTSATSVESVLAQLQAKEIVAQRSALSPVGIVLDKPHRVFDLPGFSEGQISVQDTAAQLAAPLLELAPQQTVLDACTAPGGKLAHILETQTQLKTCIAIESDATRLQKVKENLERLHLDKQRVRLLHISVQAFARDWQGEGFDRILLDAPCSGSGVIRRHPDIKRLRREQDLATLAQQQIELLTALWPLLKPNGVLVYATCSVFKEENSEVIEAFLAQHPTANVLPIAENWGVACSVGRQLFPQKQGNDGFYYARLIKQ